ncbi:hypothetical protein MY10362_004269 [Beauveria mimosiformis]
MSQSRAPGGDFGLGAPERTSVTVKQS